MKLPRDINGGTLVQKLKILGYRVTRQTGSHLRLTTALGGEHHITIPDHDPIKVGTLNGILGEVAQHFNIPKEELLKRIS